MLWSILLPLLSIQLVAAGTKMACSMDNCYRALVANNFPTRNPSADCSAYLGTTTIGFISSVTVTAHHTTTATSILHPGARDLIIEERTATSAGPIIPTYASACSGSIRYSSACSCIGVTIATISSLRSTVTVSVTSTTTSTLTQCANSLPTFAIQVTGDVNDPNGNNDSGNYAQVQNPGQDLTSIGFFGTSLSEASTFSLDAAGHLVAGDLEAGADTAQSFSNFEFIMPADGVSEGVTPVICSISKQSQLTCSNAFVSILQTCTGLVYIGDFVAEDCYSPVFNAVPLCTT